MKKLRSLTFPALILAASLVGVAVWISMSPEKLETLRQFAGQKSEKQPEIKGIESESSNDELASGSSQAVNGNSLVHRSRLMMQENIASFSAEILQIIQTPERTYQATGTYIQTSRLQSRLEINMEVKGIQGRLLQVSNGQVIWTVRELKNLQQIRPVSNKQDFSGLELRIERVDLKRLSDFAEAQNVPVTDPRFAREFSAGIPGLLAALEAEMNFTIIKQVTLQGVLHYIVQGEWKTPIDQRQFSDSFSAVAFAGEVPQRVRLYLRASDLMLARYLCLKKRSDGNGWIALLAMELSKIVINESVNPSTFHYSPTGDQVPKDVTHKYLGRLEKVFEVEK